MSGVNESQFAELMTPAEVAQVIRVHRKTVLRWVRSGTLPGTKIPGTATVRIPVSEVVLLMERSASPDLAGDLAAWLTKRDGHRESELCPRCAVRSIDKGSRQGFCVNCTTDIQIADDEAKERERARKRRWWNENGSSWRAEKRGGEKQDA